MSWKNRTIIIDVDDVLRNTSERLVELYNTEFHSSLTKEDITNYDVNISFPLIRQQLGISATQYFFKDKAKEVFYQAEPTTGAQEAFSKLSKTNNLVICTKQAPGQNQELTLKWLKKYKFNYDGICFLQNKSLLLGDIIVDDNPDNFKFCKTKNAVLITMPFNKDINLMDIKKITNCGGIYRFKTFKDFADSLYG